MKIKTIIQMMLLVTLLATLTLCSVACGTEEQVNPHNEVASSSWSIDASTHALVRYDFNADGKPLGVTRVLADTLLDYATTSTDKDSRYTYDRDGKLVGHKYCGGELTLTFDENGRVVSGVGYDSYGTRVSLQYELDESGHITRVVAVRGGKPLSSTTKTYTYDGQGRVVTYQETSSLNESYEERVDVTYTESSVTVEELTLRWDAEGRPTQLLEDGKDEPRYTWTWDESGRLVASSGRKPETTPSAFMRNEMTYDASGRLTGAVAYGEDGSKVSEVRCEYDTLGTLTRHETHDFVLEYTLFAQRTSTMEFTDGVCTQSTTIYYEKGADGTLTEARRVVSQYAPLIEHHQQSTVYEFDEQGKAVIDEIYTLDVDEQGRYLAESTDGYTEDGEPQYRNYRAWSYGEDGISFTTTTGEAFYEPYYGEDLYTDIARTSYYNEEGVLYQKVTTSEWVEEGVETSSNTVYQLDAEERTLSAKTHTYKQGELITLEQEDYNYDLDNERYKTFTRTDYEAGEVIRTYSRTEYYAGWDVSTEKLFSDGVLRTEIQQYNEDAQWKTAEYTRFTRPINETVKSYGEDGKLLSTDKIVYAYHDTCYLAKAEHEVYDADGTLTDAYVEEYDEAGVLVRTVRNG